MPAASEPPPPLPHTWRPWGALLAVVVFGTMLVVLCAFVWYGLEPDYRAQFTLFQRGTLIVLMLLFLGCYHALVRSRVVATEAGLVVVNGWRSHRLEWSQVVSVSLGRGAPWGTLDLSDGTTLSMIGIQGSDGARARRAVRQLRATVAAHSPG
ncbi:PH domain-containing protein [Nocardioides aequoreus]|uniref:PH domain-containing protein n=1 Tax=Nocardioides aequoreus TaxID=397278 RepID=UPI0004C3DC2D|nr:PH domain-containing protein [Nocardioides aequoreus]